MLSGAMPWMPLPIQPHVINKFPELRLWTLQDQIHNSWLLD
jgi:hypothetical protein